ncbi:MAG: hypothetical protein QHG99_09195 [Methanomicrobiales archaeon]|nr:hypothetical protein [Methanomicrobiales archaeon]
MKERISTPLKLHSQTKERLDELLEKFRGDFGSIDELLMHMMDVFDKRMACPRGGAKYRDR